MHLCARNAAFRCFLSSDLDTGQVQVAHSLEKKVLIGQQFKQGCHKHVAGGAHIAFKIELQASASPI
jgi:hypothetical protein